MQTVLTESVHFSRLLVSVGVGVGFVWQHQIPPVETVFAAIGDDVPRQPDPVLCRIGQQVATAATVNTDDRRLGFQCDAAARYTVRLCQPQQSPTTPAANWPNCLPSWFLFQPKAPRRTSI
jgi:hypothetical protein